MKLLKKMMAMLVLVPLLALAEEGHPLDHAPDRSKDLSALQNGAKLFVNYCLNCHSASMMRYNRLRDIGLTEEQIKENLLFTGEKVGDLMKNTALLQDSKVWFGVTPPDLSVITRAKSSEAGPGVDWIYTYLRTYYKDDTRPTGWNNLVFPNVGMPHVLWELQGIRTAKFADEKDAEGKVTRQFAGFEQVTKGKLTPIEYDTAVADLVGYLQWMSEPAQNTRKRLGVWVLLYLGLFLLLAWRLNASYWKDVK
ncbi:cytochrome c1 [Herbaspirillum sp. RTI4]|uniref:cytochrome c1 n=1 Tax=Herbaspirillum sp. RTI4 TaxID=3048640 RepID=UPI002AB3B149|nr:cytochrome c1 [Herbaspirillum sp. RTI4]MDY7577766.1 cytochrome c1 [Herbaspirillum sp. RTI4]MEA9980806.1 cytochrome c1 [Herbaspirillum sp. RTI4]